MIQFNLLPDVKIDYMKASRTKRIVFLAAIGLSALALFIFILLFLIVNVFQKQYLNAINKDIASSTQQLKSVNDLDKVLTVQNQLGKLTDLHEKKPVASRLYDYLIKLTPNDAKISHVKVDFTSGTMELGGTAKDIETVNKFVDTIKFTDFKEGTSQEKAFSDVVLSSFTLASGAGTSSERSSYVVQLKFNPAIFDGTKTVELVTPNIISTRSVTEKPSELFESPSTGTGR